MNHTKDTAPSAIAQIAINARDLERATAFYRDVIGLEYLFNAPGMAFFECGGVRLMLAEPSAARYDHAASIIYYDVSDIDASHAAMVERGAISEREPHSVHAGDEFELWMAFINDSEGNVFALVSQRAVARR